MEFRLFTPQDYAATLATWVAQATERDLFPNEIEAKLAWIPAAIAANVAGRELSKTLAYGVFEQDSDVAVAICELVLTDKGIKVGKWLKMLKVTLSPELTSAIEGDDVLAMNKAVIAYKAAVLGSFTERLTHDAATLKLYGRSDEHLHFLTLLMAAIAQTEAKLEARKEGRWLVINSV